MSVVETLREFSEVWKLFSEIPDDATLNVELASLYLGISVKSLARYRQNGGGPAYIQYQVENSKARNQRVNYLLKIFERGVIIIRSKILCTQLKSVD